MRCRPIPARDVAEHKARDTSFSQPRDAQRSRTRRNGRENDRRRDVSNDSCLCQRASIVSIRLAQIFWNELMSPWITGVPLYWMRNSPLETVPIDSTLTPYCAAIARTLAREAEGSDTTARPPPSPKSAYSAGSFADSERISICADSPL